MNDRQKEALGVSLRDEKNVLKALRVHYTNALADVKNNLLVLQSSPSTQSKIYQADFQKQLESQLSGIIDTLQGNNFISIADYLNACYTQGFVGAMYDLQGQGVPLVLPINQKLVLKAVQKTGDDFKLANKIGVSTKQLKNRVQAELSRGLASNLSYTDIARNISGHGQANMNRSMLIARTEGHRVQNEARMDALTAARAKGADVVKQWDATLDGKTRQNHQAMDGQFVELEESFSAGGVTAPYPGGFGDPAEDCNCRCAMLQRARWAVEGEESYQKWNNETGGFIECSGYDDFREKYLSASEQLTADKSHDKIDTYKALSKDQYQKLVERQDIDYFDSLRLRNFDYGYIGTSNSFAINDALRSGTVQSLPVGSQKTIELLNESIKSNKIPQNMQVTRYADENFLKAISKDGALESGTVITEKGFLSTSVLSDDNVFTDRPVKMTMNVKKGTNAFITDNTKESEIIFGSGTKYEIVKIERGEKTTELVVNILG